MASFLGAVLRGVGKAVDGVGLALQAPYGVKGTLNKAQTLLPFKGVSPTLGAGAFVAPSASVIGAVKLAPESSVWYGAVVRADVGEVSIGEKASILENAVVHVAKHNPAGTTRGASIGAGAVVAQGAVVHAADVGAGAVVGMGATLLDGSKLEDGALLAAGAVLSPGTVVPSGAVWSGIPARHLRDLSAPERAFLSRVGDSGAALASLHAAEMAKGFNAVELDDARREDRAERDPDYDLQNGVERDHVTREIIASANH